MDTSLQGIAKTTRLVVLRKRVFLKSPVRLRSRTPRSVRGLLGNWQSYRDGSDAETD